MNLCANSRDFSKFFVIQITNKINVAKNIEAKNFEINTFLLFSPYVCKLPSTEQPINFVA